MEWLTSIKTAIDYIENHIEDRISIDDVASSCYISTYYLQVGFQILTSYSIGEYIRNRKLYLAALDIKSGSKIIDVAIKYSYETPESFTKAFKRFYGFSPSQIKRHEIDKFGPLTINISIKGGKTMDLKFKITKLFPIKLIGFPREFEYEDAKKKIPLFYDEICEKYCYPRIYRGLEPENEYEKAIMDYCIGEFGVCIEHNGKTFTYLIAGKYNGGPVPQGMKTVEFEMGEWAIFDIYGPCPKALQEVNDRIFKEWLPLNNEYELRDGANLEWYDTINGNKDDENYHSQIWIPVRKIKK